MVKSCCVWGCTSRYKPSSNLSFHNFPSNRTERGKTQRAAWVAKVGRLNEVINVSCASSQATNLWEPSKWSVVCGRHFISGKPHPDPNHPDYCPSLYMKPLNSNRVNSNKCKLSRYDRSMKRQSVLYSVGSEGASNKENIDASEDEVEKTEVDLLNEKLRTLQLEFDTFRDSKVNEISRLNLEIVNLRQEKLALKSKVQKLTVNNLTDKKLRYLTGVENVAVFKWVLSLCDDVISVRRCMPVEDQLLLCFMKLRLGLQNNDLAYRFQVSSSTVSDIFNDCIPVLAQRLKFLIKWPSRAIIKKNMPHCFKRFSRCRVIIDCTEFFIDRPYNLSTRAKTWSNYKHHHTLKALIGITPYGAISFVSDMWGGRISDKDITARSGFYQLLEPGDQVMADRGFTISQELAINGAHLVMPPFVAGRKQFPGYVVTRARQISSLRIHVERAIGRIKKYAILKNTMPASIMPLASEMLCVCCALTNLKPKLVK